MLRRLLQDARGERRTHPRLSRGDRAVRSRAGRPARAVRTRARAAARAPGRDAAGYSRGVRRRPRAGGRIRRDAARRGRGEARTVAGGAGAGAPVPPVSRGRSRLGVGSALPPPGRPRRGHRSRGRRERVRRAPPWLRRRGRPAADVARPAPRRGVPARRGRCVARRGRRGRRLPRARRLARGRRAPRTAPRRRGHGARDRRRRGPRVRSRRRRAARSSRRESRSTPCAASAPARSSRLSSRWASPTTSSSRAAVGAARRVDYTVPVYALTTGRNWSATLRTLFGDTGIEDLSLPYFCTSVNLSAAELVVHDRGSLLHAARASTAIPGILPPVWHEGDLLVDGGLMNNLPVDLARERPGVARVLAVDVAPPREQKPRDEFGYHLSGWRALAGRVARRRVPLPTATSLLMQSMLVSDARVRRANGKLADWLFQPPLGGYALMDWDRLEPIADAGYRHASEALAGRCRASGRPRRAALVTARLTGYGPRRARLPLRRLRRRRTLRARSPPAR